MKNEKQGGIDEDDTDRKGLEDMTLWESFGMFLLCVWYIFVEKCQSGMKRIHDELIIIRYMIKGHR